MKKVNFVFILLLAFCLFDYFYLTETGISYALQTENNYVIYDENGDYLFERNDVVVGDEYIDKNLNSYVVFYIDENSKTGRAKYIKSYKIPKLKEKKETSVTASNTKISRGTIGIYMTHNDESYISGDGYDSVYGKGGIHDVAKALSTNLQSKSINVILDETLHIPHDTNAYSRSSVTCKKLLASNNLDGLFDIHRDGASRGYYVTKVNGEERCMVRMVIGKANPNYEDNMGFALYLMSVAQIYCPWLFVDIYMAKGHYNQALKDNMVLFEFGSHLVEKDLVLKTVPDFAEVLSAGLFGEFVEADIDAKEENQEQEVIEDNEKEDVLNGNQVGQEQQGSNGEKLDNDIKNNENPENIEEINEKNEKYNQIMKNDKEQSVNNLSDRNTTTIAKGKQSKLIIYLVLALLLGYVVVVSNIKRRNK